MGWECGICGKWQTECEKNMLCPRTIISKYKPIMVSDKFGQEITCYSFAHVTSAMQEYAKQFLLSEDTNIRIVLFEKYHKHIKRKHSVY